MEVRPGAQGNRVKRIQDDSFGVCQGQRLECGLDQMHLLCLFQPLSLIPANQSARLRVSQHRCVCLCVL